MTHTQHRAIRTQETWFSTRFFLAAVLLASGLMILHRPAPAAEFVGEQGGNFRIVGTFPLEFPPDIDVTTRRNSGWLILNPTTRRGYELTIPSPSAAVTGVIYVRSFDLDSLATLKRRVILGTGRPAYLLTAPTNNEGGASVVYAQDERGGRIFLPISSEPRPSALSQLSGGPDSQRAFQELVTIDEGKFDGHASDGEVFGIRRSLTGAEQAALPTHSLQGMQFAGEPERGTLLTLWADWKPGHTNGLALKNHQLMQWGVDGNSQDDWTNPTLLTTTCGRGRLNNAVGEPGRVMYPLGILRSRQFIVIACQKNEGVTQIIHIPLDAAGKPIAGALETRVLARQYSDTIADQQGGRLFVRTQLQGSAWWIYDAHKKSWVGAVGVAAYDNGAINSAGLDRTTGRFYALMPNHFYPDPRGDVPVRGGFGYTDTRLTPAPQLQVPFPDLAYPSRVPIEVDPAGPGRPRRVFVRRGANNESCFPPDSVRSIACNTEDHYLIIEDREPIAAENGGADSDRYTTDVAWQKGVTAANFDRSASGFGARFLSISGVSGMTSRTLDSGAVNHGSACPQEDRELVFGEVVNARVSNSASVSQANGLRIDQNTESELEDPVAQCWPTPQVGTLSSEVDSVPPPSGIPPMERPGTASASCTDDKDVPGVEEHPPSQSAKVKCGHSTGTFDSSAAAEGVSLGVVSVASATSHTWVAADDAHPERGLVTYVDSVARGVQLGALGSIGMIRATAASWSGGRPGTAHAEFSRYICQVDVGAVKENGCLDDERQRQFAAQFNRSMVGNAEVSLRMPDEAYEQGTPGGYQAAIQRDRNEQFVDRLVTRDFSKAVPALELIIYRDDGAYGAAREVLQFAAVEAASQYGIYCLFGQTPGGKCNTSFGDVGPDPDFGQGPLALSDAVLDPSTHDQPPTVVDATPARPKRSSGLLPRLLRRVVELPADVLRLILSGPKELLLTAGVWMLIWLPCVLGTRRRTAQRALADRMQGVAG